MKIVKILLDNGTSREVEDLKPLSFFEEKNKDVSKWYSQREYEKQFLGFEDEIIDLLNERNLKDYAENHLDLVNEDDVEEKDISDFTDSELLEEVKDRKLNGATNIINSDFLQRFCKIIEAENVILLDNLLSELENKLNL